MHVCIHQIGKYSIGPNWLNIFWTRLNKKWCETRHGIFHKPPTNVKFWPKSFHKSCAIFGIFGITDYAWFLTFFAWKIELFSSSQDMLEQLNTIFHCKLFLKLLQLYIYLEHRRIWIILLPFLRKILNYSFCAVENLHCNFHNVKNSNCFHPTFWKISQSTFHTVETISVSHFFAKLSSSCSSSQI